ncbi:MAG TPA: DUF4390 domain-containing protein [Burkholderiales bacterium]|nr:DUF4390 domain-containing protein [Burkholderiales bacterium]
MRRFVAALALVLATPALAQPIQVNNAGLEIAETRYFLNADFHLDLTAPLLEALKSGVSLGFLVEFQLTRPRWYWFDQKTASEKLELRLSYLPLAQQYRLSSGTLYQNFPTLSEALDALGRVHGWAVLGQDQVDNGRTYVAAVRLRLDPAQLPTPFRVSAVTNREWTLTSDWKRFRFTPLAPVQEAR